MLEERRNEKRLNLTAPVRYQRRGLSLFDGSVGRDISDSGIGFISHKFFPVATELILEFQHPRTLEFIRTIGEVVWIANQPHSENFLLGAKFTKPIKPV